MDDLDFVLGQLPAPPARILEIGCGDGRLARALARAGYRITAIDPRAPRGRIFRRLTMAQFAEGDSFDAVIAVTSLHHIGDLRGTVDKVRRLLRPHGTFLLEEFAVDRFVDQATARWYYHQRQAGAAVARRRVAVPLTYGAWRRRWIAEHRDLHGSAEMRSELKRGFRQRLFSWTPYLYSYDLDQSLRIVEEMLIKSGAIKATGFRWVGERKS